MTPSLPHDECALGGAEGEDPKGKFPRIGEQHQEQAAATAAASNSWWY